MNLDPENMDPAKWGGGLAALVGLYYGFRKFIRADKQDGAASDLNVTLSGAAERVIKMLEGRINDLVNEVHKLRGEVHKLLQQNQDCNDKNLMLTNQVQDLSKRVSEVERDK